MEGAVTATKQRLNATKRRLFNLYTVNRLNKSPFAAHGRVSGCLSSPGCPLAAAAHVTPVCRVNRFHVESCVSVIYFTDFFSRTFTDFFSLGALSWSFLYWPPCPWGSLPVAFVSLGVLCAGAESYSAALRLGYLKAPCFMDALIFGYLMYGRLNCRWI